MEGRIICNGNLGYDMNADFIFITSWWNVYLGISISILFNSECVPNLWLKVPKDASLVDSVWIRSV